MCIFLTQQQQVAIFRNDVFLVVHLQKGVFICQEYLLSGLLGKPFNLIADIPDLALHDFLIDIPKEPAGDIPPRGDGVQQVVHSLLNDALIVDFHPSPRRKSQFMSQRGQQALKESINGFHMEIVIVMQYGMQCRLSPFAYLPVVDTRTFPCNSLEEIACRIAGLVAHIPQFLQDALLHFGRGLVGKGHGEDITMIILRVADDHRNIFCSQGKSLS